MKLVRWLYTYIKVGDKRAPDGNFKRVRNTIINKLNICLWIFLGFKASV
jgi:hypothetical protein